MFHVVILMLMYQLPGRERERERSNQLLNFAIERKRRNLHADWNKNASGLFTQRLMIKIWCQICMLLLLSKQIISKYDMNFHSIANSFVALIIPAICFKYHHKNRKPICYQSSTSWSDWQSRCTYRWCYLNENIRFNERGMKVSTFRIVFGPLCTSAYTICIRIELD